MDEIRVVRDPDRLRRMVDHFGMAAFVIDVHSDDDFRLAAINARHEHLTGMKHSDSAGRRIDELFELEMVDRLKANYRRCVKERAAIDYQEALDLPVGRTYWHTTLMPFLDETGQVTRILGAGYEISDGVHLELEARYQSTVLSAYLEESPDGILVVDVNNRIKTWNRRFLAMWDIPEAIMVAGEGDKALQAVVEQLVDPEAFVQRVMELYSNLAEEEREYRIPMKDGRILERYSRGLHDPQGRYWGRIWFYRDVTERELLTEELVRLSRSDPLTGVANRRAFMETLAEEYNRAFRYKHCLSVLMLDLDHFKQINDLYGHAAGDGALKAFVQVVSPELRESDCFARMGGEEFAVLLPESDRASARRLAERLIRNVAELELSSENHDFGLTVSIGVAELQENDLTPDQLLSRADTALYYAKSEGRNRVSS